MSHLTLVRHGQASFFAEDYDKLSELGEEQARRLGEHWGKLKTVVDEVFVGPRSRQRRSAELAGLAYEKAGLKWPVPTELPELDEYDLDGLSKRLAPRLAQRDAEFAQMVEIYQRSEGEKNRLRDFQKMFERLLSHWQSSDCNEPDVETWHTFRTRVKNVIRRIQDSPGRSRRVALFTSGGFIGATVQFALGTLDTTALELNWRIRNCSLTEFIFTPDRFTLDSFNSVPHLSDSQLWTHR